MKKMKEIAKRFSAMLLAAAMLLAQPGVGGMVGEAADAYYVRFYDQITKKTETTMTLVEGAPILVQTRLPATYTFDTPPFYVTYGANNNPVQANNAFAVVPPTGAGTTYELTPALLPSGVNSRQYSLDAMYIANVSEGTGTIRTSDNQGSFPITVLSRNNGTTEPLGIVMDSRIEFKVKNYDISGPAANIEFDVVTVATGFFQEPYANQPVFGTWIPRTKTLKLTIAPKSGVSVTRSLNWEIDMSGMPDILAAGTDFSISFTRPYNFMLIAPVVKRELVVEETISSVRNYPTGGDDESPVYIGLGTDDQLTSISENFTVLTQVHRYNVDVTLDWKWLPDNPDDQICVKFGTIDRNYRQGVVLERRDEDVTGKLEVTATYTYGGRTVIGSDGNPVSEPAGSKVQHVGTVDITIWGTGETPTFTPTRSRTGVQGGADIVQPLAAFGSTPQYMDVYRGEPAYGSHATSGDAVKAGYPTQPYQIDGTIFFGEKRGAAARAVITMQSQDSGAVEVYLENSPTPYRFGDNIMNTTTWTALSIVATRAGQVQMTVEYYNSADEKMSNYTQSIIFFVYDNTPSGDGSLASLTLKGIAVNSKKEVFDSVYPNGIIEYGFASDKRDHVVLVPNCVEKVTLTPRLPVGTGAKTAVDYIVDNVTRQVNSGSATEEIALEVQREKRVLVQVTAEDGSVNTYTVRITRDGYSTDSSLASLEAYSNPDTAQTNNLIENFLPTTTDYTITVPYSTEEMTVVAIPNSPWVTPQDNGASVVKWDVTGGSIKTLSLVQRVVNYFKPDQTRKTFVLNRPQPVDGVFGTASAVTTITVTVTAEDSAFSTAYTITVNCLPPSNNADLQTLEVFSSDGTQYLFEDYQFDKNITSYLLYIPYSTNSLQLRVLADDIVSNKSIRLDSLNYSQTRFPTEQNYQPQNPTTFTVQNMGPVNTGGATPDPNLDPFTFTFTVTAESGATKTYSIDLRRLEPSDDNTLRSLTVTDQDGGAVTNFAFSALKNDYPFEVPYETSRLVISPVANHEMATVAVEGTQITKNRPSYTTNILPPGSETTISIVVTAENFEVRTYRLIVTRKEASSESRLISLTTSGPALDPKFNPSTTKYNLTIPEGTNGVSFTPTAANEFATITVDGQAVASGTASQLYRPIDEKTKVLIVVTAQDGRTTTTYTINVLDENLTKKSDNADLYDIVVYTGQLSPRFSAGLEEYEVYVKNDTTSVEIVPKRANRDAKIKVFNGTREIGSYDETYVVGLIEDEVEVTVEVTSQDLSRTRSYELTIYRNNEDKQGNYTPVTEDMINFETAQDPIIVDIARYPIITGEIFNLLKNDYPDKTILFTGNDYTLSIKGSDIDTIVPNTDQYDLSISFSPPDLDWIWDTIVDLDDENYDLEPVFVHFNHHGTLPGPMKLTLTLGQAYRNTNMHWNYFNAERERVDYYGYVSTNAKGTFALPLLHMSDYVMTEGPIIGAENRVGALSGYYDSVGAAEAGGYFTGNKPNPNTGAREDEQ